MTATVERDDTSADSDTLSIKFAVPPYTNILSVLLLPPSTFNYISFL
jgi:hypothetical protein